jgi:predicted metal-dependent hydrolase
MNEVLQIDGLAFNVRRSQQRKTLELIVGRSGDLTLRAPEAASIGDLEQWAKKKLLWVHRKLALKENISPKLRRPEYVSGEAFAYLGRRYPLKLVPMQDVALRFESGKFLLRRDETTPEAHFREWYIQTGSTWLGSRADLLSKRTRTVPNRVEVRDLGFIWGSCSKNGALLFDWTILQLPVRLIDYVLLHELVHLEYRHHQSPFWHALERALPDWRNRKDALHHRAKDYLVFGLPSACE